MSGTQNTITIKGTRELANFGIENLEKASQWYTQAAVNGYNDKAHIGDVTPSDFDV